MDGLFEHYPATPDTVRGEGTTLANSGDAMFDAAETAARATMPAADNVLGMLLEPVRLMAKPLTIQGSQLRAAAGFAGSALNSWATAISLYNAKIDALNQEYVDASATRFGVIEPAMKGGQTNEARDMAWDRYGDAIKAAKDAKVADLVRRKRLAADDLDGTAADIATMLGRGPNQKDWNTLGSVSAVPMGYLPYVEGGGPGEAGGPHFVIGPPTKPDIEWDEDFIYGSKDAGWRDHLEKAKWTAKLRGGQLIGSDLDDATQMYGHYWDNNGDPIEFDYEEAYHEDEGVQVSVDKEIARAQRGAKTLINGGNSNFSMTGDATAVEDYPTTENWQKTIGGHQQWSSADVSVNDNQVTMEITVHGEDHYNFNKGQSDIASEAPDDANGRFTEIGWAKPFDSHGTITRTITWELGQAPDSDVTESGDPQRNPGREDREDERESGDPDRPRLPDNNRETGGPRSG